MTNKSQNTSSLSRSSRTDDESLFSRQTTAADMNPYTGHSEEEIQRNKKNRKKSGLLSKLFCFFR